MWRTFPDSIHVANFLQFMCGITLIGIKNIYAGGCWLGFSRNARDFLFLIKNINTLSESSAQLVLNENKLF